LVGIIQDRPNTARILPLLKEKGIMKKHHYILTFHKWILIWGIGLLIGGCEFREEPMQKLYKAKPVNSAPARKKNEDVKKDLPPTSIDSIAPPDSTNQMIKDTTESLQQIEKKPEIKSYKKIYFYNLHKKAYIS
jgi:hypothetical protein